MKKTRPYRLILADDHVLLRDALANLINNFDEFSVIATAGNGKEVIEAINNGVTADMVLMDLNMPIMDGYEAAKWLAEQHPKIKIVVLTMYDSEIAMIRLLQTGVNGFLKKDINPSELKTALLSVAAGAYYYSNHTNLKMESLFQKSPGNHFIFEKSILNDSEIEFLKLAGTDMNYKDIARVLRITPRQIDNYRDNLFLKLNVKSRVGLVIYAIKNGIISF